MSHKIGFISTTLIKAKQKGSALVIAVFVIVVMSLLGLSLIRMLQTSGNAVAYEVLGTRAYQSAQIGIQFALSERFPLAPSQVTHCDGSAVTGGSAETTSNITAPNFSSVKGLLNCRVSALTCSDIRVNNTVYFTIESTGECISADVITTRTLQVTAKSLD
jgi:MSHA biogenesis protein MshP